MNFSQDFSSFLLKALIFSLLLAGVHYLIGYYTNLTPKLSRVIGFHIFISLMTIAVYAIVVAVGRSTYDRAGFAYLGLGLIKMMGGVAFLWPRLQNESVDNQVYVVNFFTLFFIYLVFEAWEVVQLIRRHSPH